MNARSVTDRAFLFEQSHYQEISRLGLWVFLAHNPSVLSFKSRESDMGSRAMQVGSVRRSVWTLLLLLGAALPTFADVVHPGNLPSLSSRPGAAYTVFLDFDGFSFTGTWGSSGKSPGDTLPYLDRTADFSSNDASNIKKIWARVAEKYSAWDINVTTIDPAAAAGQTGSDAQRQAYYDSTADVMHTVIGGDGTWSGGGGVSYVGVTRNSYSTTANNGAGAGWHTNWVFAAEAPNNLQFVGEASAHENGHGFGLGHQGDHFGTTSNEYSNNNKASGNGSYAPIMGDSYSSQRGTWRVGTTSSGATQNDVKIISSNPGITSFLDDAIGHSRATATPLPLLGNGTVNFNAAKGVIVPTSTSSPQPIGVANYRSDFFSFQSFGAPITLTANDGGEFITPGTADPGVTLDSTLSIFDALGNLVATATNATSTLAETYSGTLPAGTYFAQIASAGGYTSTYDSSASYYEMGSYFLTGSGFNAVAVPEPTGAAAMLALLTSLLLVRGRRTSTTG